MSILEEILREKVDEVAQLKQEFPLSELKLRALERYQPRGFASALRNCSASRAIIAEFKRGSPSKGVFRRSLDPIITSLDYAQAGACCISVITDHKFFAGTIALLPLIRDHLQKSDFQIPLLRKDFIIDEYQVWHTRAIGADAMLLIVAALDDETLLRLFRLAFELDLDVLIEIHDQQELERAIECMNTVVQSTESSAQMILGINNRCLKTFETSLSTTERLATSARELLAATNPKLSDTLIISESGIFSRDDIDQLSKFADGYLIGEALVASGDPRENLEQLL